MSDDKQKALDGEMAIPTETTNEHDRTYENEGSRDLSPMVQISLKEYDKLKEKQHYITDKSIIDIIDQENEDLNNKNLTITRNLRDKALILIGFLLEKILNLGL